MEEDRVKEYEGRMEEGQREEDEEERASPKGSPLFQAGELGLPKWASRSQVPPWGIPPGET